MNSRRLHLAVIASVIVTAPLFASADGCPNPTRNLSLGSRGADVVQLQQFLLSQNLLAAGSATGYFGKLTQAAVQRFQRSKGIVSFGTPSTTGYGAVGPKTRAVFAACGPSIPNTGPPPPECHGASCTSSLRSCTFNGQTIAHGSSITLYKDANPPAGTACVPLARLCLDGTLLGESAYQYASCTASNTTPPSPPPIPIPPTSTPNVFSVKDYGAKCDLSTDDTAAIQAAENAREAAGGGTLFFPLGFCRVSGTITITKGGTILGSGHGATGSAAVASVIRTTSPSADVFDVITPDAITFQNLQIDSGGSTKTTGAAILVEPSVPPYGTVLNRQSRFQDVTIYQGADGIALYNVADFNITGATISDFHNNGIYINNGAAVDAGQSLISGSTIWDFNVTTGAADIRLDPAANVNLVGDKLLGGQRGVWLTVSAGPTGTFTMSNNSIEEQSVSGVYVEQTVPGKKYANIIITNNQFGNDLSGVQSVITLVQGHEPYLSNVSIANNITQVGLEHDAQFVINDGNGVSITGNVLDNLSHIGAFGIMTGGNATNVTISGNTFSNIPSGNYGSLTSSTVVH